MPMTVYAGSDFHPDAQAAVREAILEVRVELATKDFSGHQWQSYGVDVSRATEGFKATVEIYDFESDGNGIWVAENAAQARAIAGTNDVHELAAEIMAWVGPLMAEEEQLAAFNPLLRPGRGQNLPGLLSSNGGRDFAAFLGAVGERGYCAGWRVLDALHYGVPQRHRCLSTWHVGEESFSACGGLACYREHLVLMSLRSPRAVVKVLCHELGHVTWDGGYLNAAARQVNPQRHRRPTLAAGKLKLVRKRERGGPIRGLGFQPVLRTADGRTRARPANSAFGIRGNLERAT